MANNTVNRRRLRMFREYPEDAALYHMLAPAKQIREEAFLSGEGADCANLLRSERCESSKEEPSTEQEQEGRQLKDSTQDDKLEDFLAECRLCEHHSWLFRMHCLGWTVRDLDGMGANVLGLLDEMVADTMWDGFTERVPGRNSLFAHPKTFHCDVLGMAYQLHEGGAQQVLTPKESHFITSLVAMLVEEGHILVTLSLQSNLLLNWDNFPHFLGLIYYLEVLNSKYQLTLAGEKECNRRLPLVQGSVGSDSSRSLMWAYKQIAQISACTNVCFDSVDFFRNRDSSTTLMRGLRQPPLLTRLSFKNCLLSGEQLIEIGNILSKHPLKSLRLEIPTWGSHNAENLGIRDDHVCLLLQSLPATIAAIHVSGVALTVSNAYGELRWRLNQKGSCLSSVTFETVDDLNLENDHDMPTLACADRNKLRKHRLAGGSATSTGFALCLMSGKLSENRHDAAYQRTMWLESFHTFVVGNLTAQWREGRNPHLFSPSE